MTATTQVVARVQCIQCAEVLPTDERLLVGEVIHCTKCNAQHEVYELDPVQIGPRERIETEEADFESWTKAG